MCACRTRGRHRGPAGGRLIIAQPAGRPRETRLLLRRGPGNTGRSIVIVLRLLPILGTPIPVNRPLQPPLRTHHLRSLSVRGAGGHTPTTIYPVRTFLAKIHYGPANGPGRRWWRYGGLLSTYVRTAAIRHGTNPVERTRSVAVFQKKNY